MPKGVVFFFGLCLNTKTKLQSKSGEINMSYLVIFHFFKTGQLIWIFMNSYVFLSDGLLFDVFCLIGRWSKDCLKDGWLCLK